MSKAQKLCERWQTMQADRMPWLVQWQEIADLMAPMSLPFSAVLASAIAASCGSAPRGPPRTRRKMGADPVSPGLPVSKQNKNTEHDTAIGPAASPTLSTV